MTILGTDRALSLAERALAVPGADAVEIVLMTADSALTRFADSRIHQNTARDDGDARIRVVVDGNRVGVVATNDLSEESLRAAATAAVESARATPPDRTYAGLAQPADYPDAGVYDEPTAACSPAERAEHVGRMLALLPQGVAGAGAFETSAGQLVVVNSNGVRAYTATTRANCSILAAGDDSTGYAEDTAARVGNIDCTALAQRAADKVALGRHPRDVAPGDYAVVLEPAATATLVEFLCYIAFNGKEHLEGRSPLAGRVGEQVCDPSVTIVDDALSPQLPGLPFDFEGVPKRRVPLIDHGVAAGVVYDLASAHAAGRPSTGHGLPAPNPEGAFPLHPSMAPGDTPSADLVAGMERGLVVTRFHYTNVVNPMDTSITGMTRDGTFLVEDGRIVCGVRNLRFTQSILEALSGVQDVGRETEASGEIWFGCARTPAVRLAGFAFTSATSF